VSPSTRQPSAGWQIFTPVGWYTAHSALQQSPHVLHVVPSIPALQSVAPVIGCVHVPSMPAPIVQMPPQQSASCAHASPLCTQNDDGPHVWFALHSAEQQSPSAAHALPFVLQEPLSAVHV